jgi:DNA adenine methylase|tara:strand:- start:2364 stop:3191 length:828 start_codon:yes stop_codon:yes gene_type:complete
MNSEWLKCPVVMPYYGGKFELSRRLVPMLAPHNRYIEVFAGGLSMMFRKPKAKWNVVNDIDNDIVNLYICVVEEFEKLCEYIYWYPRSRQLYYEIKKEVMSGKDIQVPDPKRAARYLFLIKLSYNKNPYTAFSKSGKEDWSTKMLAELKISREKFNQVTIENLHFAKLVDKYPPQAGDMWYLDPPYVAAERGDYYFYDFGEKEHKELKECVDTINENNGKFMVSYDDKPLVRELYNEYNIVELPTIYTGNLKNRNKVVNELAIINYPQTGQESLF